MVRCGAAGDCDRCLPPASPRAVRFYGDPIPSAPQAPLACSEPGLEIRLEARLETRLETRLDGRLDNHKDGLPSYESAARRSGQWSEARCDSTVSGASSGAPDWRDAPADRAEDAVLKDWSGELERAGEKQDEWQDEGESIVANCSDSPLSNCLDSPELVPRIGFHNDVKECAI
ncbi:hypothetical protein FJT64_018342 [Amphibalanus amphitrite]|uniref:Uncharacterized protein n=1 Tax=Amphibalanus amphitrite TaxID=1232801 RepID=A0A6A4X752_AMPAM|nr:hypothetical protein FJT64_018342 [Amphibalanus amphitrite]